jgi:uncharacterized protein
MPNVEKHAPGSFCWIELATTDQNAAKPFYTQLFPWSILDQPMGPSGTYTLFQVDGQSAAAAYSMPQAMLAQNIPPHWDLYVSVESADETVKRSTELGGKTLNGPFDVMDYGRLAAKERDRHLRDWCCGHALLGRPEHAGPGSGQTIL